MFAALRQLGSGDSALPAWQRTPTLYAPGLPPTAFSRGGFAPTVDGQNLIHVAYDFQPNYNGGVTKISVGQSLTGLTWTPGSFVEKALDLFCAKASGARWASWSYVQPEMLACNPDAAPGQISHVLTFSSGVPGVSENNMGWTSLCVVDFCLTSTDGVDFIKRPMPDGNWHICKYVNGKFIALDFVWAYFAPSANVRFNNRLAHSSDGINWTVVQLPLYPAQSVFQLNQDVTFFNGLWWVTGDGGYLLSSPDLVTWTRRLIGPLTLPPGSPNYSNVVYGRVLATKGSGPQTTVACAGLGSSAPFLALSEDATQTFSAYHMPGLNAAPGSLTWYKDYLVATSYGSTTSVASQDGKLWLPVPNPTGVGFQYTLRPQNALVFKDRLLWFTGSSYFGFLEF